MQARRPLPGAAGPARRDAVIVYHAIGRVPRNAPHWNGFIRPERFEAQMEYLAAHRRVVSLKQLLEERSGPGTPRVAITFDDGYLNVLEHAVPVLRGAGMPATFFVPTKWIGRTRGWSGRSDVALPIMDAGELRMLDHLGFAVESHGHAHIDYARSGPEAVLDDIRTSVQKIGELLGRPPRYLAYPYGRLTEAAATEARRLGLEAAFVLDHRQAVSGPFAVPRVPIVPADARLLFALKTAGRYSGWRHSAPVRRTYRLVRPLVRNRWLWP